MQNAEKISNSKKIFTKGKKECNMPAKILFVDDEQDLESLISQKFRKKIVRKNIKFFLPIMV
ncbi:hypothetical protein BCD67_14640 [Oscillatoriales cyanobacterium USR001]|nr:hypothetical protein BCD67_14640 [Oscillatoriales cyanobacterium USR001]